jgi:hypothetical protein
MLINCLCGMKRKAHGAQEPRHIQRYVEVTKDITNGYNLYPLVISYRATRRFGDSPAQTTNQRFPQEYGVLCPYS